MNIKDLIDNIYAVANRNEGTLNAESDDFEKLYNDIENILYEFKIKEKLKTSKTTFDLFKKNYDGFVEKYYEKFEELEITDEYFDFIQVWEGDEVDYGTVENLLIKIEKKIRKNGTKEILEYFRLNVESFFIDINKNFSMLSNNIIAIIDYIIGEFKKCNKKNQYISLKTLKSFVNSIENLTDVALPIFAGNNENVNIHQSNDYKIKSKIYLLISDAKSLRSKIFEEILVLISVIGEYNFYIVKFLQYQKYFNKSTSTSAINKMIINFYKGNFQTQTKNYYLCKLYHCDNWTLMNLMVLCNEVKEVYKPENIIVLAKRFFKDIKIIIDDNTIKQNVETQSLYNVNSTFDKTISLMKKNFDTDKQNLNNLLCQEEDENYILNINIFLLKYCAMYIKPLSKNSFDDFFVYSSELQRLYISTLYNELNNIRGVVNLDDLLKLDDISKSDHENGKFSIKELINVYENFLDDFNNRVEKIYQDNLSANLEKISKSSLGQEAIKNKERHICEFFRDGLYAYNEESGFKRYSLQNVKDCYIKIKSNEKLTNYLAVAKVYYDKFIELFPFESGGGDLSFLVMDFIKCVERYLKEVLAQHFPDKIHSTKNKGTQENAGILFIQNKDNITADFLSHRQDNTYYERYNSDAKKITTYFNGIECGNAYYALKYIFLHYKDTNINGEFIKNDNFCREWVSKIRNGYFHIDAITKMDELKENKEKTAYWFMFIIKNLPALYR